MAPPKLSRPTARQPRVRARPTAPNCERAVPGGSPARPTSPFKVVDEQVEREAVGRSEPVARNAPFRLASQPAGLAAVPTPGPCSPPVDWSSSGSVVAQVPRGTLGPIRESSSRFRFHGRVNKAWGQCPPVTADRHRPGLDRKKKNAPSTGQGTRVRYRINCHLPRASCRTSALHLRAPCSLTALPREAFGATFARRVFDGAVAPGRGLRRRLAPPASWRLLAAAAECVRAACLGEPRVLSVAGNA